MNFSSKWTGPEFDPTPIREGAATPQQKTAETFDPAEFRREISLEISEHVLKPLALRMTLWRKPWTAGSRPWRAVLVIIS
jgi:hypothetical protein